MPEESKTKKAEICFSIVQRIQRGIQATMENFLGIGKDLCLMQEKGLWRYYGDHLRTFNDFLRDIHIGSSTAYNCIAIWKRFGREFSSNTLEIPEYSRLVKILPVVTETNKQEWIEKAIHLEYNDLVDEVRVAKGKTSYLNCPHANSELFIRCKDCGKFYKKTYGEIRNLFE